MDYAAQHATGFNSEGATAPDKLFDNFHCRRKVTISGGQGVLARGTLLGKVTATGEYVVSTAAANDGSQDPRAVLLHEADTTGGDVEGIVGRAGTCGQQGVIFGAGHTAASVDDALIDRGIYLKNIIGA